MRTLEVNEVRVKGASAAIILVAVLAALIVGYALAAIAPANHLMATPEVAAQFVFPQYLQPKPRDRFLFPAVTLMVTVVVTLLALTWNRLRLPPPDKATFGLCMVGGLILMALTLGAAPLSNIF